MTDGNLPPGCTQSDIDNAHGGDEVCDFHGPHDHTEPCPDCVSEEADVHVQTLSLKLSDLLEAVQEGMEVHKGTRCDVEFNYFGSWCVMRVELSEEVSVSLELRWNADIGLEPVVEMRSTLFCGDNAGLFECHASVLMRAAGLARTINNGFERLEKRYRDEHDVVKLPGGAFSLAIKCMAEMEAP